MTDHTGVIDIARNGVDAVIRLEREVAELRARVAELERDAARTRRKALGFNNTNKE